MNDDWCEDCGESRPCSCDQAEEGWLEEDEDDYYEPPYAPIGYDEYTYEATDEASAH